MKNQLLDGFIGIIVAIVIALALGIGGIYYVTNQKQEVAVEATSSVSGGMSLYDQSWKNKVKETDKSASTTGAQIGTEVKTEGWKTYDAGKGFQFKYPTDWSIDTMSGADLRVKNPNAVSIGGTDKNKISNLISLKSSSSESNLVMVENVSCDNRLEWNEELGVTSRYAVSNITVSANSARRIDFEECGNGANLTCQKLSRVCIPDGQGAIILNGPHDQYLEAILSTFKIY